MPPGQITPATPPAARVTPQPTQNSKKGFFVSPCGLVYSAFALVAIEFLLEVISRLYWPS